MPDAVSQLSLKQKIEARLRAALQNAFGQDADPLLKETQDAKFGDYQANVAMSLAKTLGQPPRSIAQMWIDHLQADDLFAKVEIAGPGFVNLHLQDDFLKRELQAMLADARLGVAKTSQPQKQVVDFSGVNLAKEMHIGHLRTTVTGEVICRVLEFLGHAVERVNHVGDWGTPFGMLLELIHQEQPAILQNPESFRVQDLEVFYKRAKQRFDDDAAFADLARKRVVALQSGDPVTLKLWQAFLHESLRHCHALFKTLDVTLTDRGESFYNAMLADVVSDMQKAGQVREDAGAVCFFSKQFQNRDGDPLPLIVKKNDGGYNYATTDLAAIRYRLNVTQAERVIYITDIRQAQHFAMVFEAARAMQWVSPEAKLEHLGYGMILNKERRPFKSREGGNVLLKDVIQESVERARAVLDGNGRDYTDSEKADIAAKVGLAAIKYFDLSHNLASDYVFDWDQMLAMEGNTGPYMLYAFARIQSIGRKAGVDFAGSAPPTSWVLAHPSELALAKFLLQFPDVVARVADDLKPHFLTDFLYNLGKVFNTFYDKKSGVAVLDALSPQQRESRLALCALTSRVLQTGLNLLSIATVEKM